ncbi:MAG: hypothetical protein ABI239_04040 [Aquihabitans sp.]
MNHCLRHYEEPVTDHCRSCNHPFCSRCLVYSFGPKKPPYCVGCALTASGVRNGGQASIAAVAPQPSNRRVEKATRRLERDAAKAQAKANKRARKSGEPLVATEAAYAALEHDSTVPAPSELMMSGQPTPGQPL